MENPILRRLTKDERQRYINALAHYYITDSKHYQHLSDDEILNKYVEVATTWRLYE